MRTKEDIAQAVCKEFKVVKQDLINKNNKPKFADPRFMLIGLFVEFGYTKTESADFLQRERTTGIYGYKRFKDRIETDEEFYGKYLRIKKELSIADIGVWSVVGVIANEN